MNRKRKIVTMLVLVVMSVFMMMPMTAGAAKLKKVNVDAYVNPGKNYTVFAYVPFQRDIKVRTRKSVTAPAYPGIINYGATLTVNTSKFKKGAKVAWIPVYVYNGRSKTTGYVLATDVKLHVMYTKKFSKNKLVDRAIKTGFQYLGTPFVMPGSSLSNGIDCAQFANAIYRTAGRNLVSWAHTDNLQAVSREIFYHTSNTVLSKKELNQMKPGDLVFYRKNDTTGPIDHVGVYIGDGFMINSSGHYGSNYPNGGVCLKKVQYGARYIVRVMRLSGM